METSHQLRETLKQLAREEGRTLLVSSHDMAVIQDVCQRMIIVKQGAVIISELVDNLLQLFRSRAYRFSLINGFDHDLAGLLGQTFPSARISQQGERLLVELVLPRAADLYTFIVVVREAGLLVDGITQEETDLEEAFLLCGKGPDSRAGEERRSEGCIHPTSYYAGRYSFNTLSGLITTYIVFMLLLTGARAAGGARAMTGVASLEFLVFGYCVWVFVLFGYQELAWNTVNEAQMGTLEKLYLSPVGFGWVSGFSQIAILVVQLVFTSVLLASIVLTTGVQLQFDGLSIMPLLLVTVSAAYGLGFAMGG